jgi:hypothetical protein
MIVRNDQIASSYRLGRIPRPRLAAATVCRHWSESMSNLVRSVYKSDK